MPIGKAKMVREGDGLTVVSYGRTLPLCVKAAAGARPEGIDAEVIDLRVALAVRLGADPPSRCEKTGRVLFVNEDTEVTNFGEHLLRRTVEELFYELLAPAAAARRQVRPRHRPGRRARDGLACRSSRTSPTRCERSPASSPDGVRGSEPHFLECSPTMLPSVS